MIFHIGDIVRSNQSDELSEPWKDASGIVVEIENDFIRIDVIRPGVGTGINRSVGFYPRQLYLEYDIDRLNMVHQNS